MIKRIDIYLYTYLEINKDGLANHRLYFCEIGTESLLNAFSDSGGIFPMPTPVVSDCNGSFPKLFINKPYRAVISDDFGVQIFAEDYNA